MQSTVAFVVSLVSAATFSFEQAAPLPSPLPERVEALIKTFKGNVTFYAKNLDTGKDASLAPDTKIRTASTIKLPILCALESSVAAGRVRWDEPVVLRAEDKISGSGVLKDLSPGTTLTIRDLATLMIIVSDNTATNLILDRISADAVNDFLDTLGLPETRALRKVRSGDNSPPAGVSRAGRMPANERFGLGVSTPREMVRLLELLAQGRVVSAEVSQDVLATLKRQQYKDGIGRRAGKDVEVASKSGTLDALRSDVGILYAKGGRIAIAITVDGMPVVDYSPDNAGSELIWEISKTLMETLASPAPARSAER